MAEINSKSTSEERTDESTDKNTAINPIPAKETIGTTEALFGSEEINTQGGTESEGDKPPGDEFIDIETNKDKLVKLKIDGVETILSLTEVIKNGQLEGHLNTKLQAAAAKEKLLNEQLRLAAESRKPSPGPSDPLKGLLTEEDSEMFESLSPVFNKLSKKIDDLSASINVNQETTRPLVYANNMNALDGKMIQEGLTDFKQYLPKIEEYIYSKPVEQQMNLNNLESFEMIYKSMKMDNRGRETAKPKPAAMSFESGGNRSSAPADTNKNVRHENLMQTAIQTGRTEDWQKVFANMYG